LDSLGDLPTLYHCLLIHSGNQNDLQTLYHCPLIHQNNPNDQKKAPYHYPFQIPTTKRTQIVSTNINFSFFTEFILQKLEDSGDQERQGHC
jgi:hypothetical protein